MSPRHLEPPWLTITLWDFGWVTRAGRGEPFADLDRTFRGVVERGYNATRIDAMPLLLLIGGPNPPLAMAI
ncbi:MAG TPA: cellulase-like family protein [Chloroflexota bacterium]|nr:cellulase-like family protein [Chloroflexota bacterium]